MEEVLQKQFIVSLIMQKICQTQAAFILKEESKGHHMMGEEKSQTK